MSKFNKFSFLKIRLFAALTVPLFFCQLVKAEEWIRNVQVASISGYAHGYTHYVWLSSGSLASCEAINPTVPVLNFSEQDPGGKALLAMLMMAVTTKAMVDVQVRGCSVYEVYLK